MALSLVTNPACNTTLFGSIDDCPVVDKTLYIYWQLFPVLLNKATYLFIVFFEGFAFLLYATAKESQPEKSFLDL